MARSALAGAVYAPVGLATHYHTVQIHPYWADSLDTVGTIGAHRFYRWRGAAGRSQAFTDAYLGGEPVAAPAPRHAVAAPAETDPLVLARVYEETIARPAPAYATQVQARADDAPFREAGQVREEYANSGQWLRQP